MLQGEHGWVRLDEEVLVLVRPVWLPVVLDDCWLIYLAQRAGFILVVVLGDLRPLLLTRLGLGVLGCLYAKLILLELFVDVAHVRKFVVDDGRLLLLFDDCAGLASQIALDRDGPGVEWMLTLEVLHIPVGGALEVLGSACLDAGGPLIRYTTVYIHHDGQPAVQDVLTLIEDILLASLLRAVIVLLFRHHVVLSALPLLLVRHLTPLRPLMLHH